MEKRAELYRMLTSEHVCPYGIKSKDLLLKEGFEVNDHHLKTREETDQFKEKYGVKTTPQAFINEKRIGGYDELRDYFGKKTMQENTTSYAPVIAVFSVSFLMAIAVELASQAVFTFLGVVNYFVAFSMCILAIQKLQDLFSFSNQFITYDLLARRFIKYSYVYPFAEAFVGVGMLANMFLPLVALVALFIGSIGAISVFKAVYVDERELKCACVGGDSNVPLGFISLSENLIMVAMGLWLIFGGSIY